MEKAQILLLVRDFSTLRDFIAQNPPPLVSRSYSWKRQRTSFAGPNPSILRPKYSLSLPCRKIFVHLRLPQERVSPVFTKVRRR